MYVCIFISTEQTYMQNGQKDIKTVNNEKNSHINLKRQRMTNEFLNKLYCREGNFIMVINIKKPQKFYHC